MFTHKKKLLQIVFLGGICACGAWAYFDRKWDPLIAAISLALGFLATLEKKGIVLAGTWSYRVTRCGTELSHAGRCTIHQEGDWVEIDGHRYLHRKRDGTVENGDWSWKTEWGQISRDGHLRFDYRIHLTDITGHVDMLGICRVEILDDSKKMSGPYFKLSPVSDNSDLTEWGTITLHKLDKNSCALDRPSYDTRGFEDGLKNKVDPASN